jgi:hypothetical protein
VVTAASEPASYTWNFSAGNDAAGGIADYRGANKAAPIDISGGQANASSTRHPAAQHSCPWARQKVRPYCLAIRGRFTERVLTAGRTFVLQIGDH